MRRETHRATARRGALCRWHHLLSQPRREKVSETLYWEMYLMITVVRRRNVLCHKKHTTAATPAALHVAGRPCVTHLVQTLAPRLRVWGVLRQIAEVIGHGGAAWARPHPQGRGGWRRHRVAGRPPRAVAVAGAAVMYWRYHLGRGHDDRRRAELAQRWPRCRVGASSKVRFQLASNVRTLSALRFESLAFSSWGQSCTALPPAGRRPRDDTLPRDTLPDNSDRRMRRSACRQQHRRRRV